MGHSPHKPEVTAEEIEHARQLWVGFTGLLKWGVLTCVGLLVFLALIFFSG